MSTERSSSESLAAALLYDQVAGHRLMYHYQNAPNPYEQDLHTHHGFAEFKFGEDLQSATGDYFNGRGRNTYGTLELKRVET